MCRSGCCSNTANKIGYVSTYSYGTSIPTGQFICENSSIACGYGVAGNSFISLIIGICLCCCIIGAVGYCMRNGKGIDIDDSEGSIHEEVIEEVVVEEIIHHDGGPQPGNPYGHPQQQPGYSQPQPGYPQQ